MSGSMFRKPEWMKRKSFSPISDAEYHKIRRIAFSRPYLDLVAHLKRQKIFSLLTFGPGNRTVGVIDHIEEELDEIRKAPDDLEEWVDVILLALDGAWRTGASPEEIAGMIEFKQTKNEKRKWPDWRTQDPDKKIKAEKN